NAAQNLDRLGERLGTGGGHKSSTDATGHFYRATCARCGARRIDKQLPVWMATVGRKAVPSPGTTGRVVQAVLLTANRPPSASAPPAPTTCRRAPLWSLTPSLVAAG